MGLSIPLHYYFLTFIYFFFFLVFVFLFVLFKIVFVFVLIAWAVGAETKLLFPSIIFFTQNHLLSHTLGLYWTSYCKHSINNYSHQLYVIILSVPFKSHRTFEWNLSARFILTGYHKMNDSPQELQLSETGDSDISSFIYWELKYRGCGSFSKSQFGWFLPLGRGIYSSLVWLILYRIVMSGV